jgi:hypothetical protein
VQARQRVWLTHWVAPCSARLAHGALAFPQAAVGSGAGSRHRVGRGRPERHRFTRPRLGTRKLCVRNRQPVMAVKRQPVMAVTAGKISGR